MILFSSSVIPRILPQAITLFTGALTAHIPLSLISVETSLFSQPKTTEMSCFILSKLFLSSSAIAASSYFPNIVSARINLPINA